MKPPRLRTVVVGTTALFVLFALGASVGLVFLVGFMRQAVLDARAAGDSVRVAEELKADLLAYGRISDLVLLTDDGRYVEAHREAEARLLERLREARLRATSEHEHGLLDAAQQKVEAYLEARRSAEKDHPSLREILLAAATPLKAATTAMEALVQVNLAQAHAAQVRAERWDLLANVFGLGVTLAFLLGVVGVTALLGWYVHRPLVGLGTAIARFAAGERASLEERGPQELRTIARTFNEMADQLARRERERLVFLGGVAHDLRSPLTGIMGASSLLTKRKDLEPEQTRSLLCMIDRQAARLDRMVGDLLDATRIEAGQLELRREWCDLREQVREEVALFEHVSATHAIELRCPEEPTFAWCDPVRIGQVLANLLSNAIKYSPQGGAVTLVLRREAGDVEVCVTDQGLGIPAEDHERIFEPFHRGHSRNEIPGVGLGLSVARRIMRAHGGDLGLTSVAGEGSTFRVRLPTGEPPGVG